MNEKINRPLCPNCGSKNVAFIINGRPIWNDKMEEQLGNKRVTLGGCMIYKDSKRWECNDCHERFGNIDYDYMYSVLGKHEEIEDYIKAHIYTFANEKSIKDSELCGCFHCLSIFQPQLIKEWIDDLGNESTALCPYCGNDSIIGDSTGYPIKDKDFLEKMHNYWFSTEELS